MGIQCDSGIRSPRLDELNRRAGLFILVDFGSYHDLVLGHGVIRRGPLADAGQGYLIILVRTRVVCRPKSDIAVSHPTGLRPITITPAR